MNAQQGFLDAIKRTALANEGRPPGETRFYRDTGLSRDDLWAAGYANYGEACEAAGFSPNRLQQAISEAQFFEALARLTRSLGRFPSKGQIEVARKQDRNFPSYEVFTRRGPLRELQSTFAAWCRDSEAFTDVAGMLDTAPSTSSGQTGRRESLRKVVTGYVYLMKYGKTGALYKIGLTENVGRRHSQLEMMSPTDVRKVHVISTDDPAGIERYWHERFADKRVKTKELFRLTAEDVAAFRSRTYQ